MELKMFTSRVIVSGPLKHLIFLLLSIKCQHVSEFISTLHFDVCLHARLVLEMSLWHPNRILLTRPPCCCCYFTKCLWVCCRENTGDKGIWALIRNVFLGTSHSGSVGSFHSQQIDTVICNSPKNHHMQWSLLSPLSPPQTLLLECALLSFNPLGPEALTVPHCLFISQTECNIPKKPDHFATIYKFRADAAWESDPNPR